MALDLAEAYGWVCDELDSKRSVVDSIQRIIDRCAVSAPHRDWQRFRDLPFDEFGSLRGWFETLLLAEPPGVPLQGLWIGIFNPEYENGPTADFYIAGSNRFDPNSDSNDWACNPIWRPERRNAHSKIMAAIYRIAYNPEGLENEAEYLLCLAYTALAVRELLNVLDSREVSKVLGSVGVAVGFDSGDFLLLGHYTRDGLGQL